MDIRKIYSGSIQDTTLAIMLYGLPTTTNQRVFPDDVDSLINMATLVNKLANSNAFDIQSITSLLDMIKSGEAKSKYGYKKEICLLYYMESDKFYLLPNTHTSKASRKKKAIEGQLRMVI